MSDFRKNPETPFKIWVPNKIRKHIVMHEKEKLELGFVKPEIYPRARPLRNAPPKKRGSMWSRFTNRVKKFLK